MTFTPARPFLRTAVNNAAAVTASVRLRKSDGAVRVIIGFNNRAQETVFGGPLAGRRVQVEVGRGADHGKVRLAVAEAGGHEVKSGPRGSAQVVVAGWDLIAAGAHASLVLPYAGSDAVGHTFDLPPWGQPEARRAALDREFGLKPIPRAEGGGLVAWLS